MRLLFVLLFICLVSSVLAVGTTIPIQVQVTDDSGAIQPGTFEFTINISNSSTCSPVLYSDIVTKTTDVRAIVSYYINVSLPFNEQYYLCYYRDNVLKEIKRIGTVPYAFRSNTTNYALGTPCLGNQYLSGNGSCLDIPVNSSFNKTYADTLYSNIIWNYNQTEQANIYSDNINATLSLRIDNINGDNSSFNQSLTDTLYRAQNWDNLTGIPHSTPSDEDTTHFSLSSEIFSWVMSLGFLTEITNIFDQSLNTTDSPNFVNVTADYFKGDGSELTGIESGIWENISGVATYDGNVNITGKINLGKNQIYTNENGTLVFYVP